MTNELWPTLQVIFIVTVFAAIFSPVLIWLLPKPTQST